jgi:hypothetical protein
MLAFHIGFVDINCLYYSFVKYDEGLSVFRVIFRFAGDDMSELRSADEGLFTLLTMWMSVRMQRLRAAIAPRFAADQIAAMIGRGGFPTGV